MSKKQKPLKDADTTPGQARCLDLLCALFKGRHHVPQVYEYGYGIKCSIYGGAATYDSSRLTCLVVLCHDRAIRGEIIPGGPGMIGIALHPRERDGQMCDRHPTMEDAMAAIRGALQQ